MNIHFAWLSTEHNQKDPTCTLPLLFYLAEHRKKNSTAFLAYQ